MDSERRIGYRGERISRSSNDFWLEDGYAIEKVVGGLTYVSNVELSPEGEVFVAEAGFTYPYIFSEPRVSRIRADGTTEIIATDFNAPVIGLLWHEGYLYVTHRGVLSRLDMRGNREDLVTGLPSMGDHHTNHIVLKDEKLYFGQGSVSNTGVVGVDNLIPYGWLKDHRAAHDVPPYDVTLTGLNFRSHDPFDPLKTIETGPYMPIGTTTSRGQVVTGALKSNSVIYRCNLDGSDLEVYCWGLRNPYGLAASPDGRLFCLEQGADDRGSRPTHAYDAMYEIEEGAWYGFPDYLGGEPEPEIAADTGDMDNPKGFLLQNHPQRTEPIMRFPQRHTASTHLAFSSSPSFGHVGEAFITEFGSGAPLTTGGRMEKAGQSIVRYNVDMDTLEDFYRNENPGIGGGAPERPVAPRFSPDGQELWIADYGIMGTPKTGAIWRIIRE